MTFVTLLTVAPAKNRESYEALCVLRVPEEIVMDSLLDVCKLPGIVDTETFIAKGL